MAIESTVTIVTTRNSDGRHHLCIKDKLSGSTICDIEMTAEEFAGQITGASTTNVQARWSNLERIGKRREVKTEIVMVDARAWDTEDQRAAAKKAIAEFEIDGWTGRVDDALNMHRRVGSGPKAPEDTARDGVIGDAYRVSFIRFVEADS
jgi:hypothetical protein